MTNKYQIALNTLEILRLKIKDASQLDNIPNQSLEEIVNLWVQIEENGTYSFGEYEFFNDISPTMSALLHQYILSKASPRNLPYLHLYGVMLLHGIMLSENISGDMERSKKAINLLTFAKEHSYVPSIYLLGDCHFKGERVIIVPLPEVKNSTTKKEENVAEPIESIEIVMFKLENGVDYAEAFKMFSIAAEKNFAKAQHDLAFCYKHGHGINKEDHQKAFEFYSLAAQQGHTNAQWRVGRCYKNAIGTKQSYVSAKKWLKLAAEKDLSYALRDLGSLYFVTQKYSKAFHYFYEAAKQEEKAGQYNLAKCYENGIGNDINLVKALYFYLESAKQEYAPAICALGRLYKYGIGVKKDQDKACAYFIQAAQKNNAEAQYEISKIYLMSDELDKRKKGIEWLDRACKNGSVEAQIKMADLISKVSEFHLIDYVTFWVFDENLEKKIIISEESEANKMNIAGKFSHKEVTIKELLANNKYFQEQSEKRQEARLKKLSSYDLLPPKTPKATLQDKRLSSTSIMEDDIKEILGNLQSQSSFYISIESSSKEEMEIEIGFRAKEEIVRTDSKTQLLEKR